MKALVFLAPHTTKLVDIPEPSYGDNEVLLRVRRVGMCGTDLASLRGANPMVRYPRIPGHELAGTIEAVGSDVPQCFRPGQNVLVFPYNCCGRCTACRMGRPNCCRGNETLGVQRDGGLAELIAVSWEKLFASDRLDLRELALVEPLAVGHHATTRGRVTSEDTVAVFGSGAIGIAIIAAAASRGATVIAIDVDDRKLGLAKRSGAKHAISSAATDLHAALIELTNGEGPNVVFEAVGLPETFRAAVDEVAFAGRVIYLGFAKQTVTYDSRVIVMRELDIMGSRNALPCDFAAAASFLETGAFPADEVVTHEVPFLKASAALAAWNADPGDYCKLHIAL